jgi:hypothetical protein
MSSNATPAILANLSSLPRRAWTQCAVPHAAASNFGVECTFVSDQGHRFRAVRGVERGNTSVVFRVRAHYSDDVLMRGEIRNEPHPDGGVPITPHRWAIDDPHALVATLVLRAADGTVYRSQVVDAKLVGSSPAHSRWHVRSRILSGGAADAVLRGFWLDWFVDLHHMDPVATFYALARWSARQSPELDFRGAAIGIETGELAAIDCARLLGCADPVRTPKGWLVVLSSDVSMPDGSGLAFWGEMPTFAGNPAVVDEINNADDREDMRDLRAALTGSTMGVGTDFARWLANEHKPRFASDAEADFEAGGDLAWFANRMLSAGRWNQARRLGCGPQPGATGDQEDFGAVKGTWALRDPRHLREYLYCAYADSLRGTLHLEDDGSMVTAAAHPSWYTWGGTTHRSGSDRLGKREAGWGDRMSNGWTGYDDEHHSLNLMAATQALRDDPVVDLLVAHQVETDLASHRHRTGAGDAARAHGRCAQAYSQLAVVAARDSQLKLLSLAERRRQTCIAQIAQTPSAVMRPIATIGPDPRKPIRDPVTNELLPVVSMFEHGLAMVGLVVADRAWTRLVQPPGDRAARDVAELMLRYGCFEEAGAFFLLSDVAWLGGADLPQPLALGNPYMILAGGSGVGNWTFAGILAATELLVRESGPAELVEKGRRCVRYFTGGEEAHGRRGAEWWAVVESVGALAAT